MLKHRRHRANECKEKIDLWYTNRQIRFRLYFITSISFLLPQQSNTDVVFFRLKPVKNTSCATASNSGVWLNLNRIVRRYSMWCDARARHQQRDEWIENKIRSKYSEKQFLILVSSLLRTHTTKKSTESRFEWFRIDFAVDLDSVFFDKTHNFINIGSPHYFGGEQNTESENDVHCMSRSDVPYVLILNWINNQWVVLRQ